MHIEQGHGPGGVERALAELCDRLALGSTVCDEKDLLRLEDASHAHGQRVLGNCLIGTEEARVRVDGALGERGEVSVGEEARYEMNLYAIWASETRLVIYSKA